MASAMMPAIMRLAATIAVTALSVHQIVPNLGLVMDTATTNAIMQLVLMTEAIAPTIPHLHRASTVHLVVIMIGLGMAYVMPAVITMPATMTTAIATNKIQILIQNVHQVVTTLWLGMAYVTVYAITTPVIMMAETATAEDAALVIPLLPTTRASVVKMDTHTTGAVMGDVIPLRGQPQHLLLSR